MSLPKRDEHERGDMGGRDTLGLLIGQLMSTCTTYISIFQIIILEQLEIKWFGDYYPR